MDIVERLREYADNNGYSHGDYADTMRQSADTIQQQAERIRELEREAENYRSVMIAAAEEIHEYWDAHCDEEGYGPANLMYRLENGIPAEYGYKVGTFNKMQSRIDGLEHQLAEVVEYAGKQNAALHEIAEDSAHAAAFDALALPLPKAMQEHSDPAGNNIKPRPETEDFSNL